MENITQGQWFRGPSADLGAPIEQSLRFRGAQKLSKTSNDTSTGSTSGAISVWYKVGKISNSSLQTILVCGDSSSRQLNATYNSSDFRVPSCNASDYDSRGPLRDPSAWYHIVTSWDSSNTDAWINGVHQGTKSTTQSDVLRASEFFIGDADYAPSPQFFHGYLAEFYAVEGTKLDHEDFGRYNTDGVWVPIAPTISSYGTNGFHLTFDSSQTNGIGHDSSGNGNHFTASGFETTALSNSNFDNDIDYLDTPTNNVPTWNPLIKTPTSTVFSDAHLKIIDSNTFYPNVMPGTTILRGKSYWEIQYVNTPSGYPYLGLATDKDITNGGAWYNGTNKIFFVQSGGSVNNFADNTTTQAAHSSGDIRSFAYDDDTRQIQIRLNNGVAFTRTLPTSYTGDVVPMMADALSKGAVVNFGNRPFVYTPPSGYKSLAANNLPEPTIKNGKDHFEAITFTGNGAVRNITGLEFQPDLVFAKNCATGGHWNWHDSVRGATKRLTSNSSAAETTYDDYLKAFNSDGFQVGTEGAINGNGNKIVAYCFKAGGTAVSNTDGTITSSVSANTDAGFSIVSYTGTGANATVGHGLNSAPEFIITKERGNTRNWSVYHTGSGNTNILFLNHPNSQSAAATYWQSTDPTASVFSIGSSTYVNNSSGNYIAYCWHSVEGFSKFSSYTGNGNGDGQFVYLGFKPAVILLKSSTSAFDWQIYDSTRSPTNPAKLSLRPNLTNSEVTSGNDLDILANGFKCRNSGSTNNNSGSTYLYMAFAENPFGGENQPPATAR